MSIEWKIGNKYKTRSGHPATCIYTELKGTHPIVLKLKYEGGEGERIITCTTDGTYYANINYGPSDHDILGPWTEPIPMPTLPLEDWPRWLPWLAMDRSGEWFLYERPPHISANFANGEAWFPENKFVYLPRHLLPPYGGDWTTTLQRRPRIKQTVSLS